MEVTTYNFYLLPSMVGENNNLEVVSPEDRISQQDANKKRFTRVDISQFPGIQSCGCF